MGLPAGSYIGFASMSILEIEIPGRSAPETDEVGLAEASFLTGAGFVTVSLEACLWAISRMLLYREVLLFY